MLHAVTCDKSEGTQPKRCLARPSVHGAPLRYQERDTARIPVYPCGAWCHVCQCRKQGGSTGAVRPRLAGRSQETHRAWLKYVVIPGFLFVQVKVGGFGLSISGRLFGVPCGVFKQARMGLLCLFVPALGA
jgi:hypothetical protein